MIIGSGEARYFITKIARSDTGIPGARKQKVKAGHNRPTLTVKSTIFNYRTQTTVCQVARRIPSAHSSSSGFAHCQTPLVSVSTG